VPAYIRYLAQTSKSFFPDVIHHRGSVLSEAAVQKLAAHYKQQHLVDHYQAAMRVCLKNQEKQCAAGSSSSQ
jgi:hypothetical protein